MLLGCSDPLGLSLGKAGQSQAPRVSVSSRIEGVWLPLM